MGHLTLRHFILKRQVLDLYRHAIRSSRVIRDPVARGETIQWIRFEFERNRHLTDVDLIKEKVKMGRRELREILPKAH
ncbi:hypothetical protein FB45DRAFT_916163 [Roridomyces roridus]|uniref:LYR motif-containing protein 2 n=1 Tax=Roridomyces roridus TaxID=1738132 RepID=A0AAD7BU57_9AGAR|nr:hypothetical protein FB45DRAFT_916163 [Roridomyces roridus]